ncbi:hypothetical protein PKF032_03360 [Polynucleobacter yangtzensis]|uniref:Type I restriction enzyme, S subunit n=1 Tax=Polynucleobacter yangtzensis TaxID=1743159 RepID=A0ABM8CKQ3_9BURK|nr:hypothetical protein PKF032_03360 [Polynucleobacter yangtzensis]
MGVPNFIVRNFAMLNLELFFPTRDDQNKIGPLLETNMSNPIRKIGTIKIAIKNAAKIKLEKRLIKRTS